MSECRASLAAGCAIRRPSRRGLHRGWTAWSSARRRCAIRTGFAAWPSCIRARLILGLDARDGRVATAGWIDVSSIQALTLARQFDSLPLAGIIYTDIARDGMLLGPNLESIAALAGSVKTPVIASGGIGELHDLEHLAALPVAGCIVGRALYDGRFSLSAGDPAGAGTGRPQVAGT